MKISLRCFPLFFSSTILKHYWSFVYCPKTVLIYYLLSENSIDLSFIMPKQYCFLIHCHIPLLSWYKWSKNHLATVLFFIILKLHYKSGWPLPRMRAVRQNPRHLRRTTNPASLSGIKLSRFSTVRMHRCLLFLSFSRLSGCGHQRPADFYCPTSGRGPPRVQPAGRDSRDDRQCARTSRTRKY